MPQSLTEVLYEGDDGSQVASAAVADMVEQVRSIDQNPDEYAHLKLTRQITTTGDIVYRLRVKDHPTGR